MINFKDGDTIVCTKAAKDWFTENKVYNIKTNGDGKLAVRDDDGCVWTLNYLINAGCVFALIKPIVNLNKLTINELEEYVCLMKKYKYAEIELNEFIERMSK